MRSKESHTDLVMASGTSHACVVVADGTVQCWGSNAFGQLGDGSGADHAPLTVPLLSHVVGLAAGDAHTCALLADGTVQCWGDNSSGQLGAGNLATGNFSGSTRPVPVVNISGAIGVTAGAAHTCALLGDGTVKCWGDNDQQQLGHGVGVDVNTPSTPVTGVAGAMSITAGADHTCALRSDGQVWCWGGNSHGQIGDGTKVTRGTAVAVAGLSLASSEMATAISAGRMHTCAVTTLGKWVAIPGTPNSNRVHSTNVKCWGYNASGQLGSTPTATLESLTPVYAGSLSNVQSVAANGDHACALLSSGATQCWGDNADGLVGDGTTGGIQPAPTNIPNFSSVRALSLGYAHTCAVMYDGRTRCWGSNLRGQLSRGPFPVPIVPSLAVPAPVVGASLVSYGAQVASGNRHSCALQPTGTVKCWGENDVGQVGDGSVTTRWTPTVVQVSAPVPGGLTPLNGVTALCTGYSHSCALNVNGNVACWGGNANGQLGDSTKTNRVTAVVSPAVSNAVGVTCGYYHTCALIADGTMQCWGRNMEGELGNRGTTDSATPQLVVPAAWGNGPNLADPADRNRSISSHGYHTCAVDAAGQVHCWGYNFYGELGDGTKTNAPASVDVVLQHGLTAKGLGVGDYHSCAVLSNGTAQCWGYNARGGLGDGTFVQKLTPVDVSSPAGSISAVVGGYLYSCALGTGGTFKCWGANSSGQLGNGTTSDASTPVAVTGLSFGAAVSAGVLHACALGSDGHAQCWGDGSHGEIGNGTAITSSSTPVLLSSFP